MLNKHAVFTVDHLAAIALPDLAISRSSRNAKSSSRSTTVIVALLRASNWIWVFIGHRVLANRS
jgi:hypothetical protein